jgi:hypothetical protein
MVPDSAFYSVGRSSVGFGSCVQTQTTMGHTQGPKEDSQAQSSGIPPTGLRPRTHWDPPGAHQEGVCHLLVVRSSGKIQTRGHLFGGCKAWNTEALALKKWVEKVRGKRRGARLNAVSLFQDSLRQSFILDFLAVTEVGKRYE